MTTRPADTSGGDARARGRRIGRALAPTVGEGMHRALGPLPWRLAVHRAGARSGDCVLVVGVGGGRALATLAGANPGGLTAGVDPSGRALSRARRRLQRAGLPGVALHRARPTALPLADGSVDVALVLGGLRIEEPAARRVALAEIHRVLVQGGRLLLTQVVPRPGKSAGRLRDAALGLLGLQVGPPELGELLLAAGFRDVSCQPYRQRGLSWEVLRAVRADALGR